MALLSPGVEVREIDLSLTPQTAGSNFAVFCGDFEKGPSEAIILITSVQQLIDVFGKPNNLNYNSWYQCYNYLQYSNTLYVSRAIDAEGFNLKIDDGFEIQTTVEIGDEIVEISVPEGGDIDSFVGDFISFGEIATVYQVKSVNAVDGTITLDNPVMEEVIAGTIIYITQPHMNAVAEVGENDVLVADADVYMDRMVIQNASDFELKQTSIKKTGALKFIARNPGAWGVAIDVAIAGEEDFASGVTEAFEGINLNGLYQYVPNSDNKEYAIAISYNGEVVETYLVSLNEGSKDFNGKSNYIEDVINRQSSYVFCVYADLETGDLNTHLYNAVHVDVNGDNVQVTDKGTLALKYGAKGVVSKGNIITCYDLYQDKELIDIDIVIIPEEAHAEIIDFCTKRADVVGYFGARFEDVVGIKSTVAVNNLVTYITKTLNKDSKYVTFIGNYDYIYDRYNDKYRWVNAAAGCAGMRARTSNDREPWFASAGLNQGQLLGVTKLAQAFNNGQRDLLYKNAINVSVSFPGQGIVLWGQKTLTQKPSSFSRVNVRCLFNYMERAIAKMAKYVVFENNTATTRNLFVSTTKPFFDRILAKQGIEDFYIQCDESNNTPLVRQSNGFAASFYLKPTYSAEFINLSFISVNASVSFSEVVGTV